MTDNNISPNNESQLSSGECELFVWRVNYENKNLLW